VFSLLLRRSGGYHRGTARTSAIHRTLNIAMFASLYIMFGALLPPLFDRVERGLPRASLRPSGLGALVAYGFGLLLLLPALASVGFLAQQKTLLLLLYALLAMPLGAYVLGARTAAERLSILRRPLLRRRPGTRRCRRFADANARTSTARHQPPTAVTRVRAIGARYGAIRLHPYLEGSST
jgi:hypothetical protein